MAAQSLTKKQQTKIRRFAQPNPCAEIQFSGESGIFPKNYWKAIKSEIEMSLPESAEVAKKSGAVE